MMKSLQSHLQVTWSGKRCVNRGWKNRWGMTRNQNVNHSVRYQTAAKCRRASWRQRAHLLRRKTNLPKSPNIRPRASWNGFTPEEKTRFMWHNAAPCKGSYFPAVFLTCWGRGKKRISQNCNRNPSNAAHPRWQSSSGAQWCKFYLSSAFRLRHEANFLLGGSGSFYFLLLCALDRRAFPCRQTSNSCCRFFPIVCHTYTPRRPATWTAPMT